MLFQEKYHKIHFFSMIFLLHEVYEISKQLPYLFMALLFAINVIHLYGTMDHSHSSLYMHFLRYFRVEVYPKLLILQSKFSGSRKFKLRYQQFESKEV